MRESEQAIIIKTTQTEKGRIVREIDKTTGEIIKRWSEAPIVTKPIK